MRLQSFPASRSLRSIPPTPCLSFFLVDDVPRLNRLTTDRDARARISGSFDFSDPRGGIERASAREREEGRWCHQIETFLGIGCQIESGGTSAPYHSTRRRVCRMFNDGRGRFRVSETGPPNPRLVSAQPRYSKAEMPVLVCVTTRRIKTRRFCDLYRRPRKLATREYFNIFTRRRWK